MKILHLILGCKSDHYIPIENADKDTWLKNPPNNIKTIFMYGGSDKIYWDKNHSFYVDKSEDLSICLYKTILAFEHFLNSEFDYVFRSNNTGYFDYELINQFIENKPKEKFYCGYLGYVDGIKFASGSGYFLSKDLVNKVVKNKTDLLNHSIPNSCNEGCDDVIIGKFITQTLGVEINPTAKRLDLSLQDISENLDMSHYHYRILFEGNPECIYKIHELKNKNDNHFR
jgi:hypothetical protein